MSDRSPQDLIVQHDARRHGRVLAGPGTGKSTTVLRLAHRLLLEAPPSPVRVITFTRAATAELVKKIREEGHVDVEPMTVHALALSILMSNSRMAGLPLPLRIPDDYELEKLIRPDLARRMRNKGFTRVTAPFVAKRLERELAARWESLDPDYKLLADLEPELRLAYIAAWEEHRRLFRYCLFAEMTQAAARVLEDHADARGPELALLVVDEFQDLNQADIAFVEAIVTRGVHILAVGDDDQSVYSFRLAAPQAIRDLHERLPGLIDYSLTISYRCGRRILKVATDLIETAPNRPQHRGLEAGPSNPQGHFAYVKFKGDVSERRGIATVAQHLIANGMKPKEIVILMRSDPDKIWSAPLRAELERVNLPATNVEEACAPLQTPTARKLLAAARLLISPDDGLAWWAFLKLTHGIADAYLRAVADHAVTKRETFAARLRRCSTDQPPDVSRQSHRAATAAITAVEDLLADPRMAVPKLPAEGWAKWLVNLARQLDIGIQPKLADLLVGVEEAITKSERGLPYFLNQLEPIAKDLALETEGIAIMTLTRSKGLTFRAAIVMGVEEGVLPSNRPWADEDEERRLLYVGITRAQLFCLLTMAGTRNDRTAWTGGVQTRSRSRCHFLERIGVRPADGDAYLKALLAS